MGLSEAGEILRRHVIERRRRSTLRSVNLDQDPNSAVPTMSDGQFADSCLLVRGVPERTLDMLEAWYCVAKGATWTIDAVRINDDKILNVPLEQVAVKLTLSEAAHLVGLDLNYHQARTLYREAMSIVLDNLVERAQRTA